MTMAGPVLVLNAGYEELHRVSLQHAITMLVRDVVVIEEAATDAMFGPFPVPGVVRLKGYVAMRWLQRGAPTCTKTGVLARDARRCAYCGARADTVDHIQPASRGGTLSWRNTIAACKACNNRKADRTPAEAGMRLLFTPTVPNGLPFTHELAAPKLVA
jgi:hypothetical protein